MTATFQATGDSAARSPITRLWHRQLDRYPNNGVRYTSLGIVVLTTVILYYQQYLAGGVSVQILRDTHASFLYYVNITVVASIFGAIASLVAGLADRYGRANIVTAGLGVASLITLFGFPEVHTKLAFAVLVSVIGFVEGIVLVATPALIRDFSPQLGRASAMGFWTLGPVLGSLMVSGIVTPTFKGHRAQASFGWFWEYRLAGIISLVVFVIALVGLRELSPGLRDQLMVSEKDRAFVEMKAKGLDIAASLRKPFRQMLRLDIVASAFAISVFLIIYYIAVGFFPIFFQTVYGYSAGKANGIGNYFWAVDAGALIVVGYISDKLRVRKPLMVVGGILAVVFTVIFSLHATGPSANPSYGFFVGILIALSVSLGIAYAPWMASFTETAEGHNPALTATGLAVWGMVIRVVIAVAVFIAPHIVSNVSPIINKAAPIQAAEVDKTAIPTAAGATTVGTVMTAVVNPANGPLLAQVTAAGKQYATQLGAAAVVSAKVDAQTLAALTANPNDVAAGLKAIGELTGLSTPAIISGLTTNPQVTGAITALKAAGSLPPAVVTLFTKTGPQQLGAANFAALTAAASPAGNQTLAKDLAYAGANGPVIAKLQHDSRAQWRNYFWVAIGGEIVFIPLVLLMAGYWSPRKARKAEQEHEAMVAAEMAKLQKA